MQAGSSPSVSLYWFSVQAVFFVFGQLPFLTSCVGGSLCAWIHDMLCFFVFFVMIALMLILYLQHVGKLFLRSSLWCCQLIRTFLAGRLLIGLGYMPATGVSPFLLIALKHEGSYCRVYF